jgi:hypothetical protein
LQTEQGIVDSGRIAREPELVPTGGYEGEAGVGVGVEGGSVFGLLATGGGPLGGVGRGMVRIGAL